MKRRIVSGLVAFGVLGLASGARAAAPAVAKAGNGQASLAVGFDQKGVLRAKICGAQPCGVEQGLDLGMPSELAPRAATSRIKVVRIGDERRAVVVSVPTSSPERTWEAVVAAPLGAGPPKIFFAGYTGWAQGEDGLRHGGMVLVKESGDDYGILIGEQREELALCGRPTMLSATVIDARTMKLVPAKVQQLTPAERDAAPVLEAKPVEGAPASTAPLVQVVGATSALADPPGAAADGKLETSWSEGRGGSGRGEFVLFKAPAKMPIKGLSLVFRPTAKEPPNGTAPREMFVASTDRVWKVSVPADAWKTPGSRYAVSFDSPLSDDCLAVVLDTAHDESANAAVTLTEVAARTEFENADPATLAAALAGGGKRAEAAGSVLRSLGQPGFEAIAARFDELDEGGQRVALDVMDSADCSISVPVYVKALGEEIEAHREHARPRLRRCGPAAAQALREALPKAKGPAFAELANEFALVAPAEAVKTFVPMLDEREVERRRALRVALGRLADAPEANPAIRQELGTPALSEAAVLDLMRALGDRLPQFEPEASRAYARLTPADPSFRLRFLRAAPVARLAKEKPEARALLASAITTDPSPEVRAQAARLVPAPELFRDELVKALGDREMRVREAAARALAHPSGAFASEALRKRLDDDKWPIVRAASALALAEFGPDKKSDEKLAEALEDDKSWLVRRDVALALGKRKARGSSEALRERLGDREERFEVRVAAARALGDVCAQAAADELTKRMRELLDPMAPNEVRSIALASLGALTALGVPDLKQRLEPLLDKNAPRAARAAAEGALRTKPSCK